MALDDPAPMLGIHLSNLDLAPYTGPGSRPLSEAERAYLAQYERWRDDDRGYGAIQSTRPQTVGYGLNDSPAGLAAWILEKWRGWADSAGDIDATFSRDFLLTIVTLYWVDRRRSRPRCGSTSTTGWLAAELRPIDVVTVPTARRRLRAPVHRRRQRRRASGPSACTTSAGGHRCREAATSRPPRSPNCSAATSQPSSTSWAPASRPARPNDGGGGRARDRTER